MRATVQQISRRTVLQATAAFAAEAVLPVRAGAKGPFLGTRGVVLYPEDLSLSDWPERAARAGLTTIALHHGSAPSHVAAFVKSGPGQAFLERCENLRIRVEFELHAMRELLPRGLFESEKGLFRMNGQGVRTPDANLCVHSEAALEIVSLGAQRIAKDLRPTTGRYFLWGDDGAEWCRCPKCGDLSDSDQALLLENRLLKALREVDRRATLAHLAYANTVDPPKDVKPAKGVFLEWAPIHRRYDVPYEDQRGGASGFRDSLETLEANLRVFPKDTAQALEYWLDMSRFSGWKRPVPKVPWKREVFERDLESYRKRGVRHVTTFAAWIDAEYLKVHGDLGFLDEYGRGLSAVRSP